VNINQARSDGVDKIMLSVVLLVMMCGVVKAQQTVRPLRPPSVPLVQCDPYFSIWSPGDNLADVDTTHWTGKPNRLSSSVIIDGRQYRVMGRPGSALPAMSQKSVEILPTRTICTFGDAGISLTLTFLTPLLPYDIDVLSRPVTYLTYAFVSTDGKIHDVRLSFDASGEIAVNVPGEEVTWSTEAIGNLTALKVGSKTQRILGVSGDDLRIDWGYLYVAARASELASAQVDDVATPGANMPAVEPKAPASGGSVVAALSFNNIKVEDKPVSLQVILAYDDLYSIQYMKTNLRPYWRRNGWEAADLLKASAKEYKSLARSCAEFDAELMADLTKAGGEKYAKICALAYKQCFAAGKFVADANGRPVSFCKENHSNGCIATSDVFYPMAPQFLLFGPTLAKSFLVPFMNYAASPRWKFDSAPHDLGRYPLANGQVYGGEDRSPMPVEESGNLLILMAAVAQMDGNADFAGLYWKQLQQWAEYLKAKGLDPENQLCTDDFAGHMAHNVNLSAKAICGLASFGKLCEMRGDEVKAAEYSKLAKEFAAKWIKDAADGDHTRLGFDQPNTWSQKYNLVWDRVLGLDLFPDGVLRREMDYYRKIQNGFGLPLDSRKEYTKLDWTLWTATLTQNRADFDAILAPVYRFISETPDRSPLTDWYQTKTATKVGFTGRSVVGGVFMQMLYDKAVWKKYAKRDSTQSKDWAPMPVPPVATMIVPTAETNKNLVWRYTTEKPADGWFNPEFDAGAWKDGKAGFGTAVTPNTVIGTEWTSSGIWLRREIEMPREKISKLQLRIHHDEDTEVFINGVLAAKLAGYATEYELVPVSDAAVQAVKPGKNLIAVHCLQTRGGQYIDVGLADLR